MSEERAGARLPERRWRERAERRRGFSAVLPQLLTTGNLAAGFYAIVTASAGDLDRAAFAVIVAMAFDLLDGRVARYAGATSRFGVEYDSIADTVSFGVAPAVIAFNAGALQELGWTGWVLAFMFTACAALRLARFNVTPARYSGRFDGLPSPAAAGMVASFTWLTTFLRQQGLEPGLPAFLPGLGVALLGILMVSPIPYRSFKDLQLGGGDRSVVPMVLFFAVLLSKPSITFPIFGLGYTLSGPVEWWWRRRTGRVLEPAAPAGPEEGPRGEAS